MRAICARSRRVTDTSACRRRSLHLEDGLMLEVMLRDALEMNMVVSVSPYTVFHGLFRIPSLKLTQVYLQYTYILACFLMDNLDWLH